MAASRNDIKKKLAELRDVPTNVVMEDVLRLIATFLLGSLARPENPAKIVLAHPHWFCAQADELTREAATFCIRLHAYNSTSVEVWRLQLKRVLAGCCFCVRGLHEAESLSRHT